MKKNRLLSLNIQLGVSGEIALSKERIAFHEKTVRMVYPDKRILNRVGLTNISPFDNKRVRLETGYVSKLVTEAIRKSLPTAKSFDVLLIDFSNNELVRDPILMQLSDTLASLSGTGVCSNFILLLPELPPNESASSQQFQATSKKQPNSRLVVIANNGDSFWLPKKGKVSSLGPRYLKHLQDLEGDVGQRFAKKIVKRLGHFKRAKYGRGCRFYSYTADNCEEEISQLLKNWWVKISPKPDAFLYDTRSNEPLTQAIKALCTAKRLPFYRVDDLFMLPDQSQKAAKHKSATLVVDVVETGATISRRITKLKELKININKEIVAAISKGSNRQKLGDFRITSFASAEPEPESAECIQCKLALPFTSDDIESFTTLRSFDLWFMAQKIGWEPERDVPDNVGQGYEMVPRFREMLLAHGDWIAYKMEKLYKTLTYPENIFIIHPKEDGAYEVSRNLRLRFGGKLTVVQIPRKAIRAAQALEGAEEE